MAAERVAPRARILGTGSAVPEGGRLLAGETTSDLGAQAARRALEAAGLTPADLDMIVVATSTGDSPLPASAARLQQKIGAEMIPSFDVNASSAGFLYGAAVANQFVSTRKCRTVLVVAADAPSRFLSPEDHDGKVAFGDAAGAAIFGPSDGTSGVLATVLGADGTQAAAMGIPGGGSAEPLDRASIERGRQFLHVDRNAVAALALDRLPACVQRALASSGLEAGSIDRVIPQDVAPALVDAVSQRIGLPVERFVLDHLSRGNALGATIPVALDQAVRNGTLRSGQSVLMFGLGAGAVWGAAVVTM